MPTDPIEPRSGNCRITQYLLSNLFIVEDREPVSFDSLRCLLPRRAAYSVQFAIMLNLWNWRVNSFWCPQLHRLLHSIVSQSERSPLSVGGHCFSKASNKWLHRSRSHSVCRNQLPQCFSCAAEGFGRCAAFVRQSSSITGDAGAMEPRRHVFGPRLLVAGWDANSGWIHCSSCLNQKVLSCAAQKQCFAIQQNETWSFPQHRRSVAWVRAHGTCSFAARVPQR